MRVWRIIPKLHLSQAFDGEGARRFGGRWNGLGTRVVYASATLSLAAIEFFVNLDRDTEPDQLVAVSADIPDDTRIGYIEVSDLPKNWRSYPGLGDKCFRGGAGHPISSDSRRTQLPFEPRPSRFQTISPQQARGIPLRSAHVEMKAEFPISLALPGVEKRLPRDASRC